MGLNVQGIIDPPGRLGWISPPLPGACHNMGAAREHGITQPPSPSIGSLRRPTVPTRARGPTVVVPQRRRRLDPDTDGIQTSHAASIIPLFFP